MEIREYVSRNGKKPFFDWLKKLRDPQATERILLQIDRLESGNTGQCKSLGEGLHELRIHYGPGYRVYFGNTGKHIILLLCGGNKASQQHDIKRARKYWKDYRRRSWNPVDPTRKP
jgi:putative addiction module killer protein